jgi:hypothetical protein
MTKSALLKLQIASLLIGIALLVYTIDRAGASDLLRHLSAIGLWGWLVILALSFVRNLVRAGSWQLSIEPAHRRTSFWAVMNVMLAGEAIKYLTATGPFLSEPAKAAMMRRRLPLLKGFSSLAIENMSYYLSVIIFTLGAVPALFWLLPVSDKQRIAGAGVAAGLLIAAALVWLSINRRSFILARAAVRLSYVGVSRERAESTGVRLRQFEENIYAFYEKRAGNFWMMLGLNISAHLINIAEILVILALMQLPPSLLAGFVIEAATKLINLAFFFVPTRAGVYESGNAIVMTGLGMAASAGVALALVRKLRALVWAAYGVAMIGVFAIKDRREAGEGADSVKQQGIHG